MFTLSVCVQVTGDKRFDFSCQKNGFCFSKLIKTFDNGFATSKYSVTNPAVPSQSLRFFITWEGNF